jgi:hypothetical protein
MSNLLEQASLVLIPSGYKAGKVYSEIPIDGSGDLTFARNSDSTRIDSAGLVEKVRTNLVFPSENFSSWNLFNSATISTNTTTAPDGTTTADTLTFGSSAISQVFSNQGDANNTSHTVSVWAKSSTSKKFRIKIANSTTGGDEYSSNLTTTSSWQRFEFTFICPITHIAFTNEAGGGAGSIDIWGAQLEVSDFGPTAYIPTTSSAVSVGPYSNIPRLNYQNGGGGCPSLLLEAQRTNLFTYSEQINNSAWYKNGLTITANATTSPDGYQNADLFYPTTSGSYRQISQGINVTSGVTYTVSIFVKLAGLTGKFLQIYDVNDNFGAYFNIDNGTIANTQNGTASIENFGNGWYKCSLTSTALTTNTAQKGFIITNSSANNSDTITANGTNGFYIWGAQLEAGSYVSSYIPTLGTSVTRVADACYKTGISSLIGQSEGTVFYDGVLTGIDNAYANLINTEKTTNGSWSVGQRQSSGAILCAYFVSGSPVFSFDAGSYSLGTRVKIAFAYKSGDSVLYVNGVQLATSSATYTQSATIDDIYIGDTTTFFNYKENTQVNEVVLFPTRLTNAQLAELTA